jgi:hypothetical protein
VNQINILEFAFPLLSTLHLLSWEVPWKTSDYDRSMKIPS